MTPDELQGLAREIAARMAPDALLAAEDVAAVLGCSARYVTEEFARAPGFPRPLRLSGLSGRRGQPRWRRSDIMAWVDSHEKRPVGRPRNRPA